MTTSPPDDGADPRDPAAADAESSSNREPSAAATSGTASSGDTDAASSGHVAASGTTDAASSGLRVDGVRVTLGGSPVLDDVSLAVGRHESVALLGPSGVGKSTLLRVVAGLVDADAGRVSWDGVDLTGVAPHQRRIGLVFQDAVLFPHRTVDGNVGYGLEVAGTPSAQVRDEVARLLALVDLEGYADRNVDTLSGGQAQRVALARALAPRPRLLLLDEPFGALDRDLRERLGDEVRDLLRAQGIPALHVTHDDVEAARVADRVVRLEPTPTGARLRPDTHE